MVESTLDCIHAVWSYKERSLHQFVGTKTTELNKLLITDAKTVLYRTILCVRAATQDASELCKRKNKANHEL